jgi:hypothetical protein
MESGTMTDDEKPIGYATLREAMAVIIEYESTKRREAYLQIPSRWKKLSLPKFGNYEPQRRSPVH